MAQAPVLDAPWMGQLGYVSRPAKERLRILQERAGGSLQGEESLGIYA